MNEAFISFIIPVLNGEKDIGRCLDSIKQQKFPAQGYEIIVVDNGSTDRTQQIVRDRGCKIIVVTHVSVGALRNVGVAASNGEYLAFVDADVEISRCWLRNGLPVFEDPDVAAAGCFPAIPQPATWVQETWDLHQRGRNAQSKPREVAWLPSMNILVRRDKFIKIGGFNVELETAEDVDLCYRLGPHGAIVCNPFMQATHWGEAKSLRSFFFKEIWRGAGNVKGVLSHGLRWDELPSIGYPLYLLLCVLLFALSSGLDLWRLKFLFVPLNLFLGILPAFFLALQTGRRAQRIDALPKLLLIYLVYGLARAYSIANTRTWQQRNSLLRARSSI
jgi:glycosyltransferase involved in cell wall biosynthesis